MATKRNHSDFSSSTGPKHPTIQRAVDVDRNPPYEELNLKLARSKNNPSPQNVVHWFRTQDLRAEDNRALAQASEFVAKNDKKGSRLITVFICEPKEYAAHGIGAARLSFMTQTLRKLATQLHGLGIPLVPLLATNRKQRLEVFLQFLKSHNVSHVFANWEYEYDELHRDLTIVDSLAKENIGFKLFHDQTVIEPGLVTTASHQPRKVFTSYWHGWIPMLAKDPKRYYLTLAETPAKRTIDKPESELFDKFDSFDFDHVLGLDPNDEHLKKVSELWPAGHEAALSRLLKFLDTNIHRYGETRNFPAKDSTSRMSPYFAIGAISIRETLTVTQRRANNNKAFGTASTGVDSWVREIAFREFYRQMIATSLPHVAMNMPTSLKLAEVRTEENEEGWKQWCEGKTGVPFIDAGMRQLNTEAYMHNRLRMNVSSFLRMNLLLDYRLGMQYFANKLVDWDCCNNSFGWDPNYTVFNGVLQGEKNDPDGDYIRKWVPELRGVKGKAIFDPAGRLSKSEFEKLGYPRPQIEHSEAKDRAIQRFKETTKRIKEEEEDQD